MAKQSTESVIDRSGSKADTSCFAAAMAGIRKSLLYPDELGAQVSAEYLRRLADSILMPADNAQMLQFARALPSRQLMLVFPILATQTKRSKLTERLMLIIRERACVSLLRVGYVEFQRYYPHPLLPSAIAVLCDILKIRKIPYEPILHDFVLLTSRSLVARSARKAIDQHYSLHRLLTTYRIDPVLSFGAQLSVQLFRTGDEDIFQDSALIFEQALLQARPEIQAALLTRFLRLEEVSPPVFDQYCQIIYELLGEPADNMPVWDLIKLRDLVRYTTWIKAATIGSHFTPDLGLARFFLRFQQSLLSVTDLDQNTIVMIFPGFSITHSKRWPDTAMYCNTIEHSGKQQLNRDPGDDQTDINQADPRRPHRLPLDSIKKASLDGRVLLLLDREGMGQSTVFLDYCLSRRQKGSRRSL